jgi:hypothetical protein
MFNLFSSVQITPFHPNILDNIRPLNVGDLRNFQFRKISASLELSINKCALM